MLRQQVANEANNTPFGVVNGAYPGYYKDYKTRGQYGVFEQYWTERLLIIM